LRPGQIAILEGLTDLIERICERSIRAWGRTLAAVLQLTKFRKRLLCIGEISGIQGAYELIEGLPEAGLGARGLNRIRRESRNCRN
jgi:hypothetical protein